MRGGSLRAFLALGAESTGSDHRSPLLFVTPGIPGFPAIMAWAASGSGRSRRLMPGNHFLPDHGVPRREGWRLLLFLPAREEHLPEIRFRRLRFRCFPFLLVLVDSRQNREGQGQYDDYDVVHAGCKFLSSCEIKRLLSLFVGYKSSKNREQREMKRSFFRIREP